MKLLLIRADRIGDLVLSIPVIRAIKYKHPNAYIALLASEYAGPILEDLKNLDKLFLLKSDDSNFNSILEEIKAEKFTHAITLQLKRNVAYIPFAAKIPIRIGPYSKLKSFFYFNKGIIQHRSKSTKNEAIYNLELLKKIGIDYKQIPTQLIKPQLNLDPELCQRMPSSDIVIHPGMGGSALNLGPGQYLKLAKELSTRHNVFITFGPKDFEVFDLFQKHFSPKQLFKTLPLKELCALFSQSRLFVGPSTGPMHLAAAVGCRVFALFSPIRVQSSTRWGPWANPVRIFTPEVNCHAKYKCKDNCEHYSIGKEIKHCLNSVDIAKLVKEIEKYLGNI